MGFWPFVRQSIHLSGIPPLAQRRPSSCLQETWNLFFWFRQVTWKACVSRSGNAREYVAHQVSDHVSGRG